MVNEKFEEYIEDECMHVCYGCVNFHNKYCTKKKLPIVEAVEECKTAIVTKNGIMGVTCYEPSESWVCWAIRKGGKF